MSPSMPPTTNYRPPIATARLIAQSVARLRGWSEERRYWSVNHPDVVTLDIFEQKMVRGALGELIIEEGNNLRFLLQRALLEAGETARQKRMAVAKAAE